MSISGDVIGEIEAPARRAIGGAGSTNLGEAEARVELADHVVLGGRNELGNEGAHATLFRRLDRDIHRFEFELPAKHAAAHDPVLDFERIVVMPHGGPSDRDYPVLVVVAAVRLARLRRIPA